MKHKRKGRRIYTYHARNRRVFSPYHPVRSAIGTGVTLVLIAVLGFVGYHVVGPIVTRLNAEAESPTTTPDPFFAEVSETDPQPGTETQPTATEPEQTSAATTTTTTVTTEITTTPAPVQTRFAEGVTVAYLAQADVLADLDTLEAEAARLAGQGYHAMLLPLKQTGGMLQYASSNEKAQTCGASNQNKLTLREIQNAAKRYDISCMALMSTLEDRMYPSYFSDGSYMFQDGSTRWLDDKPDEGGKPWLDPFTDGARKYLADLAAEIADSGMSGVICTDTVFPHFFNSDTDHLGKRIQDPAKRQDALVSTLNAIADAAPDAACCMIDLSAAVSGGEEGFVPDKLRMKSACVRIDINDFSEPFYANEERFDPSSLGFEDKIAMLAAAAEQVTGNLRMYPCIVKGDLTEAQLEAAISVLAEAGYDTVYVTED